MYFIKRVKNCYETFRQRLFQVGKPPGPSDFQILELLCPLLLQEHHFIPACSNKILQNAVAARG